MPYTTEFVEVNAADLLNWMSDRKREGWQFVQMAAAAQEEGNDLIYTLRKDAQVLTANVRGVKADDHIQSISSLYLAAFVFENEAHDLFGVKIDGIAIDFAGKFYKVGVDAPMTVLTPEKIAQRERAKKLAAAQAAKAAKAAKAEKVEKPQTPELSPEELRQARKQALRDGQLAEFEREQVIAKEGQGE